MNAPFGEHYKGQQGGDDEMKQDDPMNLQPRDAVRTNPPAPGDPVTQGLQRLFASIADEPIPEDFLRLLDEIDARTTNDSEPDNSESGNRA